MTKGINSVLNFICITVLIIGVCYSLVKVNIINTKMFSPYGDGRENYILIKDELGEDFSNFIKDDAGVKIYEKEGKINIIKIGNKEYHLNY